MNWPSSFRTSTLSWPSDVAPRTWEGGVLERASSSSFFRIRFWISAFMASWYWKYRSAGVQSISPWGLWKL